MLVYVGGSFQDEESVLRAWLKSTNMVQNIRNSEFVVSHKPLSEFVSEFVTSLSEFVTSVNFCSENKQSCTHPSNDEDG